MPNPDGTLTGSDKVTLTQVFNRIIPVESGDLGAGSLGILDSVEQQANAQPATRSAFLRIVEALSHDMMAHAVGGFAAMTKDEQIASLHGVENTLPEEFNVVLGIARNIYYNLSETPPRPADFDSDNELFGKVEVEEVADKSTVNPRRNRK